MNVASSEGIWIRLNYDDKFAALFLAYIPPKSPLEL